MYIATTPWIHTQEGSSWQIIVYGGQSALPHSISSLPSAHSLVPLQRPETGIHCLTVAHRNERPGHETGMKVQIFVIPHPSGGDIVRGGVYICVELPTLIPRLFMRELGTRI